jgi:CDP-diacylglycerol--glycerol-3-phosphate 3-phosphatidyltransferase
VSPGWRHPPNLLTFLRVALVPVIAVLVLDGGTGTRWWAFGVFVFAALTDTVDGEVARRYDGVTRFGQLADPIADKLLIGGVLVLLAAVGDAPWWIVLAILAREVAVTVLRIRLVTARDLVMAASAWGKVKTVAQIVAVAVVLSPLPEEFGLVALVAALVLTLWSGAEYALRATRLVRADGPRA